jgi:hypothetical protein
VLANADAVQHRLAVAHRNPDQAEIGGAASDVGYQDQAALRLLRRQPDAARRPG